METNVDEWIDHLSAPPFATNTNTVHRIGARLRPVWGQCRVTACRTQANRFFHVQCLKCQQSVYGQYGAWAAELSPKAPDRAMRALAEFFLIEESDEKRQT